MDRPKYERCSQSITRTLAWISRAKSKPSPQKFVDNRSPDELKPQTEEEVELNGKTFQCSRRTRQWKDWDRRVTTTTWTSDEVPGGLVRLLEDEEDPNGLHVLD